MGWSKRQLVEKAYEKIGLASFVYDLSAEQLQSGMAEMDAMIGLWYVEGIRLGNRMSLTPQGGNLDDDSLISPMYSKVVYENLALSLAQNIGREISATLLSSARKGYLTLLARFSQPPIKQLPGTVPAGQGNQRWWGDRYRTFIIAPDDTIADGDDSELEFK